VAALRQITAAQQQWAQTSARPPMIRDLARVTGLAPARVQQIVTLAEPPLSLDAAGARDSAAPPPDPVGAYPDPETLGLAGVQRQEIRATLGRLDPLARQVIGWQSGLDDGVPHTLEEVATRLRLSDAAVQRIEGAALAVLRTVLRAACAAEAAR
jgi:RNA polymerase nonessential primary-like sigma factor